MRIRLQPEKEFSFKTGIPVRISDINYGGHAGNDSILSMVHEARMRWLQQWHYTEMDAGGCGLIMADAALQYKGEAFYGDHLLISMYASIVSSVSFDLFYRISTNRNEEEKIIAYVKTGMLAFDYAERKIVSIPPLLLEKIQ